MEFWRKAMKRPTNSRRGGGFVFLALFCLFLPGCGKSPARTLTGRVISKQPGLQQLIVATDDMPGFMPAMTMPYAVKDPGGFQRVQPGDLIRADLIEGAEGKYWLESLRVTGKGPIQSSEGGVVHTLSAGDKVPDVPMINQDGKTIRFEQFKGKLLLLTFIYTRCPFPDYCPLLTRQFVTIQNELAKNPSDYQKTHLLSISLDPIYDKPPVLRAYGLANLDHNPKGFQHWDFVSSTPADLQKLASSFGLVYSEQDSLVSHTMNTVLVAADGTIANMWPGNEWRPPEVVEIMRHALSARN
jgi:protein SCO1/2